MGFIYQCTNLISNKIYTGQTTRSLNPLLFIGVGYFYYIYDFSGTLSKSSAILFQMGEKPDLL